MTKNAVANPMMSYAFHGRLSDNAWTLVRIYKTDFIKTTGAVGNPTWGRITGMSFEWSWTTANETSLVTGVYFGDPAEATIRSVSALNYKAVNAKPITLSLDAPSDSDAEVRALVVAR